MTITKIQFRPGVAKEGTQYNTADGCFDDEIIRFRKDRG